MTRSHIDRLTRRIEALEAQRKPQAQRVFTVLIKNHMRRDEELAAFCAEHAVTNNDLLITQTLIPFETRPGETAREAYERELASIAKARGETQGPAEKATCAAGCTEGALGPGGRRGGATE
jgi:hypothetical protein